MSANAGSIKFHLSLTVSDISRSARFYELLLGVDAARQEPDYVKFEVSEPPLVLSLVPGPVLSGGALNHVGLRVPTCEMLVSVQYRLEAAGFVSQREDNVACCYSRQTKFWVSDPDQTLWEIYVLEPSGSAANFRATPPVQAKSSTHRIGGIGRSHVSEVVAASALEATGVAVATWHHWLGQPIPDSIPNPDASLDEVQFEGTFNQELPPGCIGKLLAEVRRALKPGCVLRVHGLVADRLLSKGRPMLPGPASRVERVPLATEPAYCLTAAGFENVVAEPLTSEPCFVLDGIPLRELRLAATCPSG